MINEEPTFKVVPLMLHHAGKPAAGFKDVRMTRKVLKFDPDSVLPVDDTPDAGERKAAFLSRNHFAGKPLNLRIHERHRHDKLNGRALAIKEEFEFGIGQVADIDHAEPDGPSDLLGGEANPFFRPHGLHHVICQLPQPVVEGGDRLAFLPEDRFAILGYAQNHQTV